MNGRSYILVVAAILSILIRYQGFHNSITIGFMFALLFLLYQQKEHSRLVISTLLILFFFQLNPFYFQTSTVSPTATSITGTISSLPEIDGNKISFEIKTISKEKVIIRYIAKTNQEKNLLEQLVYGMSCTFTGSYQAPTQSRNAHSFNYREYLRSKNISFLFVPNTYTSSTCKSNTNSPYSLLQTYRQKGMKSISEHFPDESKGIILALVFGHRGEITDDVLRSYQSLGVIHLLAVSGLHVGLISASVYYLFIRIGLTKERSIDLILFLLPIYALLAGAAPSVLRATAMALIVLLSIRGRLKINSLDGISYVCLGLLIINPNYLFQLGFQLSFLVSYTLIISSTTIVHRYDSWWRQLFAVTTLSQFVSFPIVIFHFFEISPWSIVINVLYIPFVTFFALPFAFISFICFFIWRPIGEIILSIYDNLIIFAHRGLTNIEKLPFSTLVFGKPPLFFVLAYFVSFILLLFVWEKTTNLKSILKSSGLFFLIAIIHWHLPYFNSQGEITMIDVGQGESIYIELPRRRAIYLIDTGGNVEIGFKQQWQERKKSFDVGEDVLLPFLKAKGVRNIDKLILTHGHYDHIGGAFALIGEVPVEKLLYSNPPVQEFEKELIKGMVEEGTEVIIVKRGDYWTIGEVSFVVLSASKETNNVNDQSIVLFFTVGGRSWLLTGDLEKEGERVLLRNYPNLSVDVLKAGHHGSITSTTEELVNQLKPEYVLISVGPNNRYGHPNSEMIARLKTNNIEIFRTDIDGAITYRFKGDTGFFETMINKKEDLHK